MESDPVGLVGGSNTYSYAFQNPLLFSDISGLTPDCKPVFYGPFKEAGQVRKNESRRTYYADYGYDLSPADGPLGGFGPEAVDRKDGSQGLKICAKLRMKLTIYRNYYIAEEFDLYTRYSQMVTWRCEDTAPCGRPTVHFYDIPEMTELFVEHKSLITKDPNKLFSVTDFSTPMCLIGLNPPVRFGR